MREIQTGLRQDIETSNLNQTRLCQYPIETVALLDYTRQRISHPTRSPHRAFMVNSWRIVSAGLTDTDGTLDEDAGRWRAA